jgi:protein O-GlcNAc transferase
MVAGNDQPKHADGAPRECRTLERRLSVPLAWDRARPGKALVRDTLVVNRASAKAEFELGCALLRQGYLADAVRAFRRAIAISPDLAEAHNRLGIALWNQGRITAALASYRRAIALEPNHAAARSNLAFTLNYHTEASHAELFAAHRACVALFRRPDAMQQNYPNSRETGRRLRIGYVSGDLRHHAVTSFFEPLLAAHDRGAFEVFCYSSLEAAHEDDTSTRLKAHADHWVRIFRLSDESVAARVKRDRIDLLVDLGGYTSRSRLKIFALKPAPVQVTWLGYLNTTGLDAIDYRVTDRIVDPAGEADNFNSERLIRLETVLLCYRPYGLAPPVAVPPVLDAGYVTFGSFNDLPKLTPGVIRMWARVLHAVEGSRLVIKTEQMRDARTADELRRRFAAEGIAPERLDLLAWRVHTQHHLARYSLVDVALDTFPFNGVTTTCEALWMGVPVVTVRGDRPYGRVGASLLTAVGLAQFIAEDANGFQRISVDLAHDLDRLKMLRTKLRDQMRTSPLCDGKAFAVAMERAYRRMWQEWCAGGRETHCQAKRTLKLETSLLR